MIKSTVTRIVVSLSAASHTNLMRCSFKASVESHWTPVQASLRISYEVLKICVREVSGSAHSPPIHPIIIFYRVGLIPLTRVARLLIFQTVFLPLVSDFPRNFSTEFFNDFLKFIIFFRALSAISNSL